MTFETRTVAATFEARDDATGPVIEGYAATFGQPYDMGPFWEQIDARAFNRTLGASPDVRLLVDHEGQPLARTKSGTLELSADTQGLHMRASLDSSDPDVQRLLPKMRRGDLDEMSFAFRVAPGGDEWDYKNERGTMRTLNELSLAGGDVSVVTYPANPNTSVAVRKAARSLFVEQMGREIRSGREVSRREILKLRKAVGDIEREARGLTANDTRDALNEAVNDAYGSKGWAFVEDYDDTYVYFTVFDWNDDDSDTYRQGYSLAPDGMAALTGTAEQVRRRSTYALVNDPDGDPPLVPQRSGRDVDMARRLLSAADLH